MQNEITGRAIPARLDALLFDLDGTLVDTNDEHYAATVAALARFGKTMGRAEYEATIHGGANENTRRYLFPDDPDGAGLEYVALKERLFRDGVTALAPMPGLIDLLERAARAGLGTAVVTNAPRENADLMLGAIGLLDRFDAVVLGDDLPAGKPDPGPYLEAIRLLGCSTEHAIGFEDSPNGLAALTGAGIYSVVILGSDHATVPPGADLAVDDFGADALHSLLSPFLENGPR